MKTTCVFFGFKKEPFCADLSNDEILKTDDLNGVKTRFDYTVDMGAVALVTGDIGSGKSTALRFCANQLHPSAYRIFFVTATSGTILELYKQVMAQMGLSGPSMSKATLTGMIRQEIQNLVTAKKLKPILMIDEASLLRLEVFSEIHTICQFHQDSKQWLTLILTGQSSLRDMLMSRHAAALASRVVARSHMHGLGLSQMRQYLEHHQTIAGLSVNLFDDAAVTAVHQAAGGLLRKANYLARGALIAAAKGKEQTVTAEHVRIAATEIF